MSNQQPHTPLTDTVREVYSFAGAQAPSVRKQWFDHWLAAEIAAAEQRGAIKALRDTANLSRACWAANKNLVDPDDPEVSYSFDRWLEVRADQMEGDDD